MKDDKVYVCNPPCDVFTFLELLNETQKKLNDKDCKSTKAVNDSEIVDLENKNETKN